LLRMPLWRPAVFPETAHPAAKKPTANTRGHREETLSFSTS
jgi:hypothetical protein